MATIALTVPMPISEPRQPTSTEPLRGGPEWQVTGHRSQRTRHSSQNVTRGARRLTGGYEMSQSQTCCNMGNLNTCEQWDNA